MSRSQSQRDFCTRCGEQSGGVGRKRLAIEDEGKHVKKYRAKCLIEFQSILQLNALFTFYDIIANNGSGS
jgi:hypothetical protein